MAERAWIVTGAIVVLAACGESPSRYTGDGRPPGAEGGAGDAAADQPGPGSDRRSGESPPPPPPPPKPTCEAEGGTAAVQKPVFVKNLGGTGTSWFASAAIVDLDGDGKKELVGAFYDLIVWDASGVEKARAKSCSSGCSHNGRIYAPAIVADLDGDKVTEIVVGAGSGVAAYEYKAGKLSIKAGWPVKAAAASESPEVRGLAAGDLDGDGKLEVAATTTIGGDGAQVWVLSANGKLYQPAGLTAFQAWPRYNKLSGPGNDADANGMGHHGFGCYGENVGIGNLDDDPELELVVTYDNHHVNVFNHDGTSKTASSWYTNRDSKYLGKPLDWGQFIRWVDPKVEDDHYHLHTGTWPNPASQAWLQWTASPPNVVDLNGDGRNEVVAVANAEMDKSGYYTVYNAFMALEGDYAANKDRSARRLAGWETLPKSGPPQVRPAGYYPPGGIPAPTSVDLDGDKLPETIAPAEDGKIYAVSPAGKILWSTDIKQPGFSLMYASEVTVADLNKDGTAELVLSTWGAPTAANAGHLVILDASGKVLHALQVPGQKTNGNGIGLPPAPAIGDLDGDGQLEIVVQSFEHGLDLFRVPGSGTKCLLWPTGRGNLLRSGQAVAVK